MKSLFQVTVILSLCLSGLCTGCDVHVNGEELFALSCPTLTENKFNVKATIGEAVYIRCKKETNITGNEMVGVLKQIKRINQSSGNAGAQKKLQFFFETCNLLDLSYQQLIDNIQDISLSRVYISGPADLQVNRHLLENISATDIEIRKFPSLTLDKTFFNKQAIIKKVEFTSIKNLTINAGVFNSLSNLLTLKITHCDLTNLEKDTFKSLTKLEYLSLHWNLLTELPAGIFDSMRNLTKIILSRNHLKTLPRGLFDHNPQLNLVRLDFNCFESLPTKLFAGKMKLENFYHEVDTKCSEKLLVLPEYMFENSSLKQIRILGAGVSILPEKFLFGCSNLVKITIPSSNIKSISRAHFSWSPNLEQVDFVDNKITDINIDTFEDLEHLKILRLSYNKLDRFDENILDKLTKLEMLHLKNNTIEDISDQIFQHPPTLKQLDLSNNRINRFPTPEVSFLEILELGNNDISTFGVNMLKPFHKLKSLNLKGNYITGNLDLRYVDDRSNYENTTVDLSNNKIDWVLLPEIETNAKSLKLILRENHLQCDCFATEFKKIYEMKRRRKSSTSIESRLIKVDVNDFNCGKGQNLQDVSFADLTCPLDIFDLKCPKNCSCHVNKYYRNINVNCNGQGFEEIPEDLPLIPGVNENIVVNMENNNIQDLAKSMDQLEKKNATIFDSIKQLYLTNNKIKSVGHRFPRQLNTLYLDGNQIQHLSNETLANLNEKFESSNFSLRLSDNPFSCDCSSIEFVNFFNLHYSHVADYSDVSMMCTDGEKKLLYLNGEDFCTQTLLYVILALVIFVCVLFSSILVLAHRKHWFGDGWLIRKKN